MLREGDPDRQDGESRAENEPSLSVLNEIKYNKLSSELIY